jgi:ParB/RepB/Spo0J family partition protein
MIKGGKTNKAVRTKKRAGKSKPAKPTRRNHRTVWGDHSNLLLVPVEDLIPDEENPNEMDEATFDLLIEEIREQGFDEPLLVRPHPTIAGKYQIGSGHHRTKAATIAGLKELPVIVKEWSDLEQRAALAKRNALRGDLNKEKMVRLYEEVVKDVGDAKLAQRALGFSDSKAFEKMYDQAHASLPPKAQKKLAAAKEKIKSVDDLSSVLNKIFKESGSELDEGYMVFSFGGKNHHYFQIGQDTELKLQLILKHCEQEGVAYTDYVQSIVREHSLPAGVKPAKKREPRKKVKN